MREALRAHRIVAVSVFIAILAIGISPGPALANQKGWVVQYGTPIRDAAGGVAVDGHDVYIAGTTDGAFPGEINAGAGGDVYIRKYNSQGQLQWTDQFGTPAVDNLGAGNVSARRHRVVVGGTVRGKLPGQAEFGLTDGFLRAYDHHGSVRWTYQFGTPGDDIVRSVAIARDGSVVAVGHTTGQLGSQPNAGLTDAFVMLMNRDGTLRWLRQFGTTGVDEAIGVAVTEHAIFVSGTSNGTFPGNAPARDFDGFVARLTLDGDFEWVSQFGTPAFDAFWKVGVAGSMIFVQGHTMGTFPGETHLGGAWDGVVAALGSEGQLLWARHFGSAGCDNMVGLAVDREGAVVVGNIRATLSANLACGGTSSDALAQKFDVYGNVLWTLEIATPVFDNLQGVALKGKDVYLAGITDGDVGGPNAGIRDAFLIRFRPQPEHGGQHADDDDCDGEDQDDE